MTNSQVYEHGYEDGRLDGLICAYEVAGRSDLANLVRIKRKQMQDGWTPADD